MGSLLARLKELEANLQELSRFKTLTLEQIESDRKLVWALRYGMLESIQIVIDIACAIVSHDNLGYPKSYVDCLRLLGQASYLDEALARRLAQAVGMRNILIHEYLDVDDAILFAALDRLSDLRDFAAAVADAGMNTT